MLRRGILGVVLDCLACFVRPPSTIVGKKPPYGLADGDHMLCAGAASLKPGSLSLLHSWMALT